MMKYASYPTGRQNRTGMTLWLSSAGEPVKSGQGGQVGTASLVPDQNERIATVRVCCYPTALSQ